MRSRRVGYTSYLKREVYGMFTDHRGFAVAILVLSLPQKWQSWQVIRFLALSGEHRLVLGTGTA